MKIDTSKLTPVQAQQIEAIASGTIFVIKTPRKFGSLFDGVTMELKTRTKNCEIADLIRELDNLPPMAAGIPTWHCQHTIRVDEFTAMTSGLFRNPAAKQRFVLEVSDALSAIYGPTMRFDDDDMASIFSIRITAEFDNYQAASQWYQAHCAIHADHQADIKLAVVKVATRFLEGLGIVDRLRVRYSVWQDRSAIGRIVRLFTVDILVVYRYHLRRLLAALTKTLDNLRQKA